MTPASSTSAATEAAPSGDLRASADARPHPAVLAVGSALALWMSFPPVEAGYLAWVALVPFWLLIRGRRRARTLYASAYLGGLVFWLLAVQWVRLTDPSAWLAWVVMAAVLALWWPGFLWLARRGVGAGVPLMVAAPVAWIALEFIRAFVLTGFPWYYLGHSQYRILPLIQIADVTGTWGVSLLVGLVNAWIVDLLTTPLLHPTPRGVRPTLGQLRRGMVVGLLLLATLAYGGYRLRTARFRPGPRLGLLQSNFLQHLKMDPNRDVEILGAYDALIARALSQWPPAELVVWPETSFPYVYPRIDPKLDDRDLEQQARRINPKWTARFVRDQARAIGEILHNRADAFDVPMVVGLTVADYAPAGRKKFNAALLLEPGQTRETRYNKLHLVPFGEYVPLIEALPWLTRLTPYHGELVPSLTRGVDPAWFDLNGVRYATAICFEDTVPYVVRRFFAEADGRPPDVLLNISNDGWFHGSSELDMHLAVSVFRCVENRVPLARAVNTGISAVVDGNGRIRKRLAKQLESVLVATIPLDDRTSLYTVWGEWLGWTCLAVTIGLVPLGFRKRPGPA